MAKKVSVNTLRDLVKNKGVMEFKEYEYEGIKILIRGYTPMENKRTIVKLVTENSFVDYEDGLSGYDMAIKEVMLGYLIVREYTNLNTMQDPFEMYDAIKSTGILDFVKSKIGEDELSHLDRLIDSKIQDDKEVRELDTTLGHKLEHIIDTLSGKLTETLDTVNSFDPSSLEMLTSFLSEEEQEKVKSIKPVEDNKSN